MFFEWISMNIVNDHVLQIKVSDIGAHILGFKFELNKSSISTIIAASGQQLDGDLDGIDGGVFSYEVIF